MNKAYPLRGKYVLTAVVMGHMVGCGGSVPEPATAAPPTVACTAHRAADIKNVCDDTQWNCRAPDCNDGAINVPYWLRGISYWNVLCVHAKRKKIVLSFGDSLIDYEEARSGDPTSQQYYAISQPPPVEVGKKQHVFAVCGGGGGELPQGTRVLQGQLLPDNTAQEIADAVANLSDYEESLQLFRATYCKDPTSAAGAQFLSKVQAMRKTIDDAAARLRDAIITEHNVLRSLKKSQFLHHSEWRTYFASEMLMWDRPVPSLWLSYTVGGDLTSTEFTNARVRGVSVEAMGWQYFGARAD